MKFKIQFFIVAILFLTWASAELEPNPEKIDEKKEQNDHIEEGVRESRAAGPKGNKVKTDKFNILRTSKPVPITMTANMKNDQKPKPKPETVEISVAHDHVDEDDMEGINLMNINTNDDLVSLGLNQKDSSRLFRIPLSAFKKKLVLLKFKRFLVAPLLFLRRTSIDSDTSDQVLPIQQVAAQPTYYPSPQYTYPPQYYYPQYYPQAYSYPTEYYQQPTIVQAQPQTVSVPVSVPVENTVPITESTIPVADIPNTSSESEESPSIVLEEIKPPEESIKYIVDDAIVTDDGDDEEEEEVKSSLEAAEVDEDDDIPEIVEVEPESERQAAPYVVYQVPQPVKYLRLPVQQQQQQKQKIIRKINRRQYGSIF